jgi:hypothetical protein
MSLDYDNARKLFAGPSEAGAHGAPYTPCETFGCEGELLTDQELRVGLCQACLERELERLEDEQDDERTSQ